MFCTMCAPSTSFGRTRSGMGVRFGLQVHDVVDLNRRKLNPIDRTLPQGFVELFPWSQLNDCGAARAPQSGGVPFR